jgi:hypothetical protein
MTTSSSHGSGRQLTLFAPKLPIPCWNALSPSLRVEALRLLACLMVSVRAAQQPGNSRQQGIGHE